MSKSRFLFAGLLATLLAGPALAQTAVPPTAPISPATNAADQQQIKDGLQSGVLTTGEATKLERSQQILDKSEAAGASQEKLQNQQERFENKATKLEDNSLHGNPAATRNQVMQKDIQGNINQQNRIQQGINSGQLTKGEAGKLENGQAHVNRAEANGHGKVKAHQANIKAREKKQSRHIYRKKHNAHTATPAAPAETAPSTSN